MPTLSETYDALRAPYSMTVRKITERPTILTPLTQGTYVEFPAQIDFLRHSPLSLDFKRSTIDVYFPTIVHPQLGVARISMQSYTEIPPGDPRGRPASSAHGTICFFYGSHRTNPYVLPGGEHPGMEKTSGIIQFFNTKPVGEAHFDKERNLTVLTLSDHSLPFALVVRPQDSCSVHLPALHMASPIIIRDYTPPDTQRDPAYPNAHIDLPDGNCITLHAKKPMMECMVNAHVLFKGVYLTGLSRSTT